MEAWPVGDGGEVAVRHRATGGTRDQFAGERGQGGAPRGGEGRLAQLAREVEEREEMDVDAAGRGVAGGLGGQVAAEQVGGHEDDHGGEWPSGAHAIQLAP